MIDFTGVRALTFDCYGTLIDWESGLRSALRGVLTPNACHLPDEALLNLFARLESRSQSEEFRPYRLILREVLARFGTATNTPITAPDALAESIRDWPAFDDTAAALAALKARFRLGVLSNIDDDLFEMSRPKLGVEFDHVVTAEQVRSYKPRKAHWREARRRLGLGVDQIVHVAQSVYHDVGPARELGFKTVWVNRQAGRPGATPPAGARPHLEVPDMATLASLAL